MSNPSPSKTVICDLCSSPIPCGNGNLVSASEFQQWLTAGFEPDETTIEMLSDEKTDRRKAIGLWAAHCATLEGDWLLCDKCFRRATQHASADTSSPTNSASSDLVKGVLEERCLSGQGEWIIQFIGAQSNDQASLGIGWDASWTTEPCVIPTSFSKENATRLLQLIYTTFTAINDRDSYFRLIGMPESERSEYVVVGSIRDYGALQFVARWDTSPYAAEVMIYPNKGRGPTAIFGKDSIARIALAIEEIFEALSWPKPQ